MSNNNLAAETAATPAPKANSTTQDTSAATTATATTQKQPTSTATTPEPVDSGNIPAADKALAEMVSVRNIGLTRSKRGLPCLWENGGGYSNTGTAQIITDGQGYAKRASLKYETYYKLIIATGMRRGECCGLKWSDIDYEKNSIHIQRNVVKITGEDIIVKDTKTAAGARYVYFSPEMESLLKEYHRECVWQANAYENRKLTDDDFVFRKHDSQDPMTPSTFTWRFKLILKKNGLPEKLNVHSLRHSNASLLIANGADVATVAGLLGHSQPSTTLDIYTHAFDKNKKAVSEALQQGLDI